MGLGGVGDLPKTSPLVAQPPVVGLSLWGDRVGLAVLAKRATSGQVWCPSSPGVPASQPLLVLTPGSLEYPPPPKAAGAQASGHWFSATWASGMCLQGHVSGSSRGFGLLLRLRGVGVSASCHVSPVTASVPARPRILLPGAESLCGPRVPSPQMCRYMFQTPFFPQACSFHPGTLEGQGIGFNIIMEVTAFCLLI